MASIERMAAFRQWSEGLFPKECPSDTTFRTVRWKNATPDDFVNAVGLMDASADESHKT